MLWHWQKKTVFKLLLNFQLFTGLIFVIIVNGLMYNIYDLSVVRLLWSIFIYWALRCESILRINFWYLLPSVLHVIALTCWSKPIVLCNNVMLNNVYFFEINVCGCNNQWCACLTHFVFYPSLSTLEKAIIIGIDNQATNKHTHINIYWL